MHFGPWDIILVAGVSIHATVMAYLYHPKWKTLIYSLPVPFTLASLSLGADIGVMNMTGLFLLLLYVHSVRVLHKKLHVPIVLSIAVSVLVYCGLALALVRILPNTEVAFWVAAWVTWAVAWTLFFTLPHREEPGHRTPLPVWVKLPIIVCVIVWLLAAKSTLQGFMTMFPMVGVVGAYETRHSLWALTRQVPTIMVCVVPMMVVCRLMQHTIGLGLALLLGWVALLALLIPLTRWTWARWPAVPAEGEAAGHDE